MNILNKLNFNEKQLNLFEIYRKSLLEWNQKFNLTAILNEAEIEEKHFYDSLALLQFFDLKNKTLLDVGTGAGFPGIPLAIAEPNLQVTLLESNGKKVSFLNYLITELGLTNVSIIQGRAEEFNKRESFDFVTARAVKELNILLEICFYLVKVDGMFLAYKSINVDRELENAKNALKKLSIEAFDKKEYSLPICGDSRCIVCFKKSSPTLKKYPRIYGEIVKKPL